MAEKIFIDDFVELPEDPVKKPDPVSKSARKKENLKDIISAVAEKEDVVSAFRPSNKKIKYGPENYYLKQFTGGMVFGLGFLLILGIVIFVFSTIDLNDLRNITRMFGKFVSLMKALGS